MTHVAVAGAWELGWNTPIKELDLWAFPVRDFAVDAFYMTPVSGIASKRVQERASLDEVLAETRNLAAVFVDENGEAALTDFEHPDDALYVFGRAGFSPMTALKRERDRSVRIETVLGAGLLLPHQAAAIVLHDRLVKSWR